MTARNPLPPPKAAGGRLRGFDLSGRRAIVYGAEGAHAAAAVSALREAGATVAVTSASTGGDALFRMKRTAAGGPAEAVDLSNGANVQVATRKLAKQLGGLDIAVVAPDAYFAAPIRKTKNADLAAVIDGNLTAAYAAFRSASREFGGDGGRLIALLAAPAARGLSNLSAYSAAQSGVIGLVRALSQELAPHGVTVNAIVGGWSTETPGRGPDAADANVLLRYIPMRRFGEPAEAAPLVVYLGSNAAGYLTGQVFQVDGGVLKHL